MKRTKEPVDTGAMKINKNELVNIMKLVKPGLGKSSSMVQTNSSFIFSDNEIITYNDAISIGYPFKAEFSGCVAADEFYKIVSNLPGDSVELSVKEDSLLIKGTKTKAMLKLLEFPDDIHAAIRTDTIKWRKLPEEFMRGLTLCCFSVSQDMTFQTLSYISVGDGRMVSSDNLRISMFTLEGRIQSFLLPGSAAKELVKLEGVSEYSLQGSWIHFKTTDGVIFCSRSGSGEYPDVTQLFDGVTGPKFKVPESIQDSITRAAVLDSSDFDGDRKIIVTISNGKITCRGEGVAGWIETTDDIDFKKELKFGINPDFFTQVLDKATTAVYGEDKLLFKSGAFQHVISLLEDDQND